MNLNKYQKLKTKQNPREKPRPLFVSTEGEDDVEANLSFLIELLGSSLLDTYIEDVLNELSAKIINIKNVPHPTNPPKEELIENEPAVFYGDKKGTHYTCSIDGKKIWDSYNCGFQLSCTDHFCQVFVLMCIENAFLPNSHIAKQFSNLEKNNFMKNAFIAKNVACDILELLNYEFDIMYIVKEILDSINRDGSFRHKINPNSKFSINRFIKYCRNLTIQDMENSSFKQKVFLTI